MMEWSVLNRLRHPFRKSYTSQVMDQVASLAVFQERSHNTMRCGARSV